MENNIQLSPWVAEYIRELLLNRGYDCGSAENRPIFDSQWNNWSRLMVSSGLNADEHMATEVAVEFAFKKLTGGFAKVFEQFAEFMRSRPKAITDSDFAKGVISCKTFVECDICLGGGAESIPVFEEGEGSPHYFEDLEDGRHWILEGLVRLETYDLEARIDCATVHNVLRRGGRLYVDTRSRVERTKAQAAEVIYRIAANMPEERQHTNWRITNRTFRCSCLNGTKYPTLADMTGTQAQFVLDRRKQEGQARSERDRREKGITGETEQERMRQWRKWFKDQRGSNLFRSATGSDETPDQAKHRQDRFSAAELTRKVREMPVPVSDIPEGWEAVTYDPSSGAAVYRPMTVQAGFIQPNPQGRFQKRR